MMIAKSTSRLATRLARREITSENLTTTTRNTHTTAEEVQAISNSVNLQQDAIKPYEDIPGPKPLPIFGNTWRLFPVIGQYTISDTARISQLFHEHYGKITRLTGLIGRPDLLFVYDADEIERVKR